MNNVLSRLVTFFPRTLRDFILYIISTASGDEEGKKIATTTITTIIYIRNVYCSKRNHLKRT